MSPKAKNPNPLVTRLNLESRAVRRILAIVASLDRAARGRVLRTVIELADEAANQPAPQNLSGPNGETYAG